MNINTEGFSSINNCFEAGLNTIVETLGPQRALVLYRRKGCQDLEIQARHGIDADLELDCIDIPQGVLRSVMRNGQHLVLTDGLETGEFSTSAILCGVRSVVCAPILHPCGLRVGVLYLDDQTQIGKFDEDDSQWLHNLGQKLGQQLVELGRQPIQSEPSPAPAVPVRDWKQLRTKALSARAEKNLPRAEWLMAEAIDSGLQQKAKPRQMARLWNEFSEILRQNSRMEEARTAIGECLNIVKGNGFSECPDAAPYYSNEGGLLYLSGQLEEAASTFSKALSLLDPRDPDHRNWTVAILSNLGTVYRDMGQLEKSRDILESAYDLASDIWGTNDTRTRTCLSKLTELAA